MKNLLNILGALLLSITIISCGSETKDTNVKQENTKNTLVENSEITEIIKQKTIISGKAESFKYIQDPSSDLMSINNIILSDIDCIADTKLCEELTNFIGGKKIVFSSLEEYSEIEVESPEYRLMQKGTIEINNNTYSGTLYYNGEGHNEKSWFNGKLIFKLPEVKLLKGGSVILQLKGKR
jgi:hypothetical protein